MDSDESDPCTGADGTVGLSEWVDRERVRSGAAMGVGSVELISLSCLGEGARGVVGDSGILLGDSGGVRLVSIRTVGRIVDLRTRLVGDEVELLVSDRSSTSTSSSEYVVDGLIISISSSCTEEVGFRQCGVSWVRGPEGGTLSGTAGLVKCGSR